MPRFLPELKRGSTRTLILSVLENDPGSSASVPRFELQGKALSKQGNAVSEVNKRYRTYEREYQVKEK